MHGWMMGRIPVAINVGTQVIEAKWFRISDQEAEHTTTSGTGTDVAFLVVTHPNRDELVKSSPGRIEDAERTEAGFDEGTGLLNQMSEQNREINVCLDHEDGRHQPLELLGIFNAPIRHPHD